MPLPTCWQSDQIVLGTFFNGGLRAYDISNPYQPQEVATFVPPPAPGAPTGTIQINDVFVDEREIVYCGRPPHRRALHPGDGFLSEIVLDLFPSPRAGRVRPAAEARARGADAGHRSSPASSAPARPRWCAASSATPEGRGTARRSSTSSAAVGIDDALLRESTDEVTLLGNGCLCCNTRSDLQIALRKLVADRERGKIPHFGRVLIETSGLADLSPILQTFSTDRALGGEFAIEVVLTLVDAVNGLRNLDKAPEARKQAILADRLVISKIDLADSTHQTSGSPRGCKALNPRADIDMAIDGEIDPRCLIDSRQDATAARRSGFVAEAEHSRRHRELRDAREAAAANGRCSRARWRR